MSSTQGFFSSIPLNAGWALQKGIEAVRTDRIYFTTPLLLAGYTGYHSFLHLSTASFGRDSLAFRKKLINDAFSAGGIEKIQLLSRSVIGSISLYDRAREVKVGLAYLGVSTLLLYSMHSYIKDTSNNTLKFSSTIGEGGKEIFPDQHSHEINVQALKTYGQNENFVNATLMQPWTSKFSKGTKQAVEIADQALIQQDTPMTAYIKNIRSAACSVFGSNETCAFTPPTTETMNAQGIKDVCEQTKETLHKLNPTDYSEKAASGIQSICDWTWGNLPFVSREGDCSGLKANLYNQNTDELTHRLTELNRVCEVVTERAILQGRAEYPADSLEGYNAYKTLYYKIVSPEIPAPPTPDTYGKIFYDTFSALYNKTVTHETAKLPTPDTYIGIFYNTISALYQRLTTHLAPYSSTVYTAVDNQGQIFRDFLRFSNQFPLSSSETDPIKLAHYSETLGKIIPKDLDSLTPENMPILREAASSFFGISPGFSSSEFKKAYRELQKLHHADQNKGVISKHIYAINTQFKDVFSKKGGVGYEYNSGSSLGRSIYSIPTPDRVVTDLWESFSTWWNNPIP